MKLASVHAWLATAILSVSVSAAPAKYQPGTYVVDTAHSKVGFEIPHLVISSVEGQFKTFESNVVLTDKFEKSSVKATVDMNSIDTGVTKRDDHLKSPDFFDAKKYPKMTFESTKIEGTPEAFKLHGKLNLHGVTKPVIFEGKYLGSVNDGFGSDKVAFTATTKIKRADYGLTWNKAVEAGPVVGEDLTVTLKIEAGKPAAKK
jgi:polyisoprenoid-binding protein YceI